MSRAAEAPRDAIAIIGIGCRFPKAHGPQAFWRLLCDGVDAIGEMPRDRFDVDAIYDPRPGVPGKLSTLWGGFLDSIEAFDPYFFGIAPREAERMDPQQRLLLETAWEAMEDGGQLPERLAGSRTGVFVASCYHDFDHLQLETPERLDVYASTGAAQSVLAGRLSYILDLRGPSVAVDSACSSSLVALHLACRSLQTGESELALAGGVNVILAPEVGVGFARAGMLAPDGRCKFADASANGFVRSEGVAVVLLKRLSDARRDGDRVYAVVRGSAVNNDGRSSGLLMTPGRAGQEAVLRAAYEDAGVSPGDVAYIEAHGTGTSVGDPVELDALGAVVGEGRADHAPVLVGSVKTNLGHTEGAAGMAGVIKVALSLKHDLLPPSLHCRVPNPAVAWDKLRLAVQRDRGPWPNGHRLAGVSSLGISGTNAHVVLEQAPADVPVAADLSAARRRTHLLPLSAASAAALPRVAAAYAAFLREVGSDSAELSDLCDTASRRRRHHEHRLTVVGDSRAVLADRLEAFASGARPAGVSVGAASSGERPKIAFLFPGQGSQWLGMGRSLCYEEPVFRGVIERCDRVFRDHTDWSLLDELFADSDRSQLDRVDVIQPAIFAIQIALAAQLAEWSITPDVVVGHSLGEVAASYVAGALDLEDAARIICRRSRLVRQTCGQGAMALVDLSFAEATKALAGLGDRVSIAAVNGPTSTILSGERAALEQIGDQLTARDVFWRWIKVDYASHSAQMDPLRPQLLRELAGLRPRSPHLRMVSTVTGADADGALFDESYWSRNLREPVRFWPAIERLATEGCDVFVELSPHPVLGSMLEDALHGLGRRATVLGTLRREEDEQAVLLGTVGALHTVGVAVDWTRLHPGRGRCVALPPYAFEREIFSTGVATSNGRSGAEPHKARGPHPLLGSHVTSAVQVGTHFWQITLSGDGLPYLRDHKVGDAVMLPAAAYLEMASAAAEQVLGSQLHAIQRVTFKRALVLPRDTARIVEVVLSPSVRGRVALRFFSRAADAADAGEGWVLHAEAEARLAEAGTTEPDADAWSAGEAQARCSAEGNVDEYYAHLAESGLTYGPSFRGIERLWRRDGEALGRLQLPIAAGSDVGRYGVHPVLLDAAFQLFAATLPDGDADGRRAEPYLPVSVDSFRIHRHAGVAAWAHARMTADPNGDGIAGDVRLFDDEGQLLVETQGLRCVRIADGAAHDTREWLYAPAWRPVEIGAAPRADQRLRGPWLVFADRGGLGDGLATLLADRGERVVVVTAGERFAALGRARVQIDPRRPDDVRALLTTAAADGVAPFAGVVHLWSLDAPAPADATAASLDVAQDLTCLSVLHLVQALGSAEAVQAPRLWLVTRGAAPVATGHHEIAVAQAPLWGFGRTLAHEHPELSCTRLDLDPAAALDATVLVRELMQDGEEERALRGDTRFVGRIARWSATSARDVAAREAAGDRPFRLEMPRTGVLTDLAARATAAPVVRAGEVAIEIRAAGLNFADVLSAMGIYPGQQPETTPCGLECAGIVVAVGAGVSHVRPGDEVIAIAAPPKACLASHVVTEAHFVFPKPSCVGFEAAAALPIALLTTHYAFHLARLSAGERVLIHSAAGGVGLAAIHLARHAGAMVFATAGTDEKRAFLASLGVEHVMDSRSLTFADEILERTGGAGVDVVLNSLSGEAIPKGLEVLAPYGRFLELGKRDIYENSHVGLWAFRKNLAFFAIDIHRLAIERPQVTAQHVRAVLELIETGRIPPLPVRTFPVGRMVDAFEFFRQGTNIGKVVLAMDREGLTIAPRAPEAPTFTDDATYLVTGGLGGLGLKIARWMVARGARHLVLVGRRAPSADAQKELSAIAGEAKVAVAQADVADSAALGRVLEDIDRQMPPLRGVFHCAGVLDDGVVAQLDAARWRTVSRPKIHGAWNLHALTADRPLDMFVLFSSAASLLGSPGQANYASANAFLDALAHYRRAKGLHALSVNWGPWSEVGLAAAQANRGERLVTRGIDSLTPDEGLRILDQLLAEDAAQVGAIPLDVKRWREFHPHVTQSPFYSELTAHADDRGASGAGDGEQSLVQTLRALPPGPQRRLRLEDHLREQAAQVLRLGRERIDPRKSLGSLGMDSLMAVELRNRIDASLSLRLPIATIWNFPSLDALASHVAQRLEIDLDAPAADDAPVPTAQDADDAAELAAVLEAASVAEPDGLDTAGVATSAYHQGMGRV